VLPELWRTLGFLVLSVGLGVKAAVELSRLSPMWAVALLVIGVANVTLALTDLARRASRARAGRRISHRGIDDSTLT